MNAPLRYITARPAKLELTAQDLAAAARGREREPYLRQRDEALRYALVAGKGPHGLPYGRYDHIFLGCGCTYEIHPLGDRWQRCCSLHGAGPVPEAMP